MFHYCVDDGFFMFTEEEDKEVDIMVGMMNG